MGYGRLFGVIWFRVSCLRGTKTFFNFARENSPVQPLPKTPIRCNNAMTVGIANNTVKRQQSRSMEMRFMWVGDKVSQEMYLTWHPGIENLFDYQSKHHVGSHHVRVRSYYLHMNNSPRELQRALRPSALKGCVGTLEGGYVHNVPLPRVSLVQSASHMTDTCYSQVPRVPTWSNLTRSLAGLGRSILTFSPV